MKKIFYGGLNQLCATFDKPNMKLTDFLISRQYGLSDNVIVDDKAILFKDVNAKMDLQNWSVLESIKFSDFISQYEFPKNEEFTKKDKEGIRQNIPRPQILIQKNNSMSNNNAPLIAMYLYKKAQLTGDSLLHIRSINKFEQMWFPYFINLNLSKRDNPKVFKKGFYEYCQSGDINFNYNKINDKTNQTARLRILSFAFNQNILLMYVFDRHQNELDQDALNVLLDSIKSNA